MLLLQISAGQGPMECCSAVGKALQLIEKQVKSAQISFEILELIETEHSGCFKSALLRFKDESEQAKQLAFSWQGPLLWVCQSPFRPKHKRKNWFFSGQVYQIDDATINNKITYQTCRASGAGGQHVNTTDSAIRATHLASGLSVRVESERSQHANKRLANALLLQKLEEQNQQTMTQQEQRRWQQHTNVQRGAPIRIFEGSKFTAK